VWLFLTPHAGHVMPRMRSATFAIKMPSLHTNFHQLLDIRPSWRYMGCRTDLYKISYMEDQRGYGLGHV